MVEYDGVDVEDVDKDVVEMMGTEDNERLVVVAGGNDSAEAEARTLGQKVLLHDWISGVAQVNIVTLRMSLTYRLTLKIRKGTS